MRSSLCFEPYAKARFLRNEGRREYDRCGKRERGRAHYRMRVEGVGLVQAHELRAIAPRAEEGGFRPIAARVHGLLGEILWTVGDPAGAADEFVRAAEQMKEIIATLGDEDRRSFVHHPEWKAAIGSLLDTLMRLGRREEALAYLIPLGVGSCDVDPRPVSEGSLSEAAT